MRADDLTIEQAERLAETVVPMVGYLAWQVSRLKTAPLGKKAFRELVKEVEEFIVHECDNVISGLKLRAQDSPPALLRAKKAKPRLVTRNSK